MKVLSPFRISARAAAVSTRGVAAALILALSAAEDVSAGFFAHPATETMTTNAPRPIGIRLSMPASVIRALLGNADEERTRQRAVVAGQRRIVGVVLLAEHGGLTAERVLLAQRLVRRRVVVELAADGGPALVHQGSLRPSEVLPVPGKDARIELRVRVGGGPRGPVTESGQQA